MSVNQKIISALYGFGDPISPGTYQGDSERYFAFDYSTLGADFGDDAPRHERYLVQVHFFCPLSYNSVSRSKDIKRALFTSGFTWPEMTNASDQDGQHLVFECEMAEGAGVDGEA